MLELKNILEDIVLQIVDELDESKIGQLELNQKIELASYALNRLQPMYITSNRGFSHIIKKYKNDPQFLADVMVKVDEGLRVVMRTRISEKASATIESGRHYYLLPRIYGKIISSKTLMYVDKAKVSLYIDGELSRAIYSSWPNPLELSHESEGIYSFAPRPIEANQKEGVHTFQLKIVIENDGKAFEKFAKYAAHSVYIENVELDYNENAMQVEDVYVPF